MNGLASLICKPGIATAVLVALSTFVLVGCDRYGDIAGPEAPEEALFARIQQEIFEQDCVGCHRGGGSFLPESLDLSTAEASYQNLVNVSAAHPEARDQIRVVPGDPDASFLLTKLTGGPNLVGIRMPLGGNPLSDSEIQLVRDWIAEGAPRE